MPVDIEFGGRTLSLGVIWFLGFSDFDLSLYRFAFPTSGHIRIIASERHTRTKNCKKCPKEQMGPFGPSGAIGRAGGDSGWLPRALGRDVLEDYALFHYKFHPFKFGDVGERVAANRHNVGELSRLDSAQAIAPTEHFRGF